jgi:glycosyltransferase involved in cell wall biosynthesis
MMRFKRRARIRISYIKKEEKPLFVISAIRVSQGGTLEVVTDFLLHADKHFSDQFRFIAFVYRKDLYPNLKNIEFREFPQSRKSFLFRMWMEYVGFMRISKKNDPHIWLSLQDSTPNVQAKHKYLYWGTALLQRGVKMADLFNDRKLFFVSLLYKWVYCKNINTNDGVFVQQENVKQFLHINLSIPDKKIHVSPLCLRYQFEHSLNKTGTFTFLYPCYPYAYKNIELIIEAVKQISNANIQIWLTTNGNENKYIKRLYASSKNLACIKWIGYRSCKEIISVYEKADALIYTSKCESWGIPLSLFKKMHKPILAADLPYAKETVGNYSAVKFIDIQNAPLLAEMMHQTAESTITYDLTYATTIDNSLGNWSNMIELMKHESNTGNILRLQLRSTVAETV